jgi:hypothetical protein
MQGVVGMALSHECAPLNVVYLSRMLCMHVIWMYDGLQPDMILSMFVKGKINFRHVQDMSRYDFEYVCQRKS